MMNRQRYGQQEILDKIPKNIVEKPPSLKEPKQGTIMRNLINRNIRVLHLARDMERKQEFLQRLDDKI